MVIFDIYNSNINQFHDKRPRSTSVTEHARRMLDDTSASGGHEIVIFSIMTQPPPGKKARTIVYHFLIFTFRSVLIKQNKITAINNKPTIKKGIPPSR